MALAALIEIPIFLQKESLDNEILGKMRDIQKRHQKTDEEMAVSKDKFFGIIEQETLDILKKKNILWDFGSERARYILNQEDPQEELDSIYLSDEIIEQINDTTHTAIFLTSAALDATLRKSNGPSYRA